MSGGLQGWALGDRVEHRSHGALGRVVVAESKGRVVVVWDRDRVRVDVAAADLRAVAS